MTVLLHIRGFPQFSINIVYIAHWPCHALWLYVDRVGLYVWWVWLRGALWDRPRWDEEEADRSALTQSDNKSDSGLGRDHQCHALPEAGKNAVSPSVCCMTLV